jgi:hypothetical protein
MKRHLLATPALYFFCVIGGGGSGGSGGGGGGGGGGGVGRQKNNLSACGLRFRAAMYTAILYCFPSESTPSSIPRGTFSSLIHKSNR